MAVAVAVAVTVAATTAANLLRTISSAGDRYSRDRPAGKKLLFDLMDPRSFERSDSSRRHAPANDATAIDSEEESFEHRTSRRTSCRTEESEIGASELTVKKVRKTRRWGDPLANETQPPLEESTRILEDKKWEKGTRVNGYL